ncbi:MAG: AAA family ATPase [Candidatus Hodarchaeales archaeon]|jgi:MoxR-like ATPase
MDIDLSSHSYISTPEIDITIKLALKLNRPILIEGPAGTGKTSIAISLADALNWSLYRIQCYEGITVESVIGEFDYRRQLLHIELERQKPHNPMNAEMDLENIFSRDFFIERPLFLSFISNQPNVLLIDEIDKSDEEFEAFLLEALGERQISIPELGTFKADNHDQVVILTSNSSRDLSEPLRRRCLYLYVDFPTLEREKEILSIHTDLPLDSPLLTSMTKIVQHLRSMDLRKVPSIAETIDWANSLIHLGKTQIDQKVLKTTLPVLLKYQEDLLLIKNKHSELIRLSNM